MTTKLNADVLEFRPGKVTDGAPRRDSSNATSSRSILACGNYELLANGSKTGMSVDTPAVFDLRWITTASEGSGGVGSDLLAVGGADGAIRLYAFSEQNSSLRELCVASPSGQGNTKGRRLLHRTQAKRRSSLSPPLHIAIGGGGDGGGGVEALSLYRKGMAASAEVWAVALVSCCCQERKANNSQVLLLLTGADDGLMKRCFENVWANMKGDEDDDESSVIWEPDHTAGVCVIVPHPMCATGSEASSSKGESAAAISSTIIATGSYDGHVRIFELVASRGRDEDQLSVSVNLVASARISADDGGDAAGVWRLRWNNTDTEQRGDGHDLVQIAAYREHESLAYGCDWMAPMLPQHQTAIGDDRAGRNDNKGDSKHPPLLLGAATCAFYDKSLHVWTIDLAN
eukprot:jgi/Bigna1/72735/fgenesh1_pg.21_\